MSATSPTTPAAPPETLSGLIVSLLFWLSVFGAALLFAAVALSPKLIELGRLQRDFAAGQHELVQMEQQNEQLQRVVDAIRNDPEFAAELTRIEFDAVPPDEEVIPVDSSLRLSPQTVTAGTSGPVSVPWYQPYLILLASDVSVRQRLLAASALLVVISFTWFQPASSRPSARSESPSFSVWQAIKRRYTR